MTGKSQTERQSFVSSTYSAIHSYCPTSDGTPEGQGCLLLRSPIKPDWVRFYCFIDHMWCDQAKSV